MTQVSLTGARIESAANGAVRASCAPVVEGLTVTTASLARTCAALTKAGNACRSRGVGADGFCPVHSPANDPVELGRRGGLKSGEVRREQAKSVRDRLKEKVENEFATIAAAFDAGLKSDDERVRVATATALLSEAYGKPAVAIVGDADKPLSFQLVSLLEMARELEA